MFPTSRSLSRPSAQLQSLSRRLLPAVRPGHIVLLVGASGLVAPVAHELTHHFAMRGPVRVLLAATVSPWSACPCSSATAPA